MLSALAEAEQRVVPVVRKRRVNGEREGASMLDKPAVGERKAGTGYKA